MRTFPGSSLVSGQGAEITNKFGEINIRRTEQTATLAGQTGPEQGIVYYCFRLTIDGLVHEQPWAAECPALPLCNRTNSTAFTALLAIPHAILLDNVLHVNHDTV